MNITITKAQPYDSYCLLCNKEFSQTYNVSIRRKMGGGVAGFTCCKRCIKEMSDSLSRFVINDSIQGTVACLRENCGNNENGVCTFMQTRLSFVVTEENEPCAGFSLREED